MNWLLILVVLILAGNMVWGYCRGFVRVIYSMTAWIFVLIFVTFATPYVADWLSENTRVDEQVEEGCRERMHQMLSEEQKMEHGSLKNSEENLQIQLPDSVLSKLTGAADSFMEKSGAYDKMAERMSEMAIRAVAFLIVFLLARLVCAVLIHVLDLISKLPLIGSVNHILGLAAGTVKGLFLVWLLFAFAAMAGTTSAGRIMVELIYESPILIWLYRNNLVLSILMIFL